MQQDWQVHGKVAFRWVKEASHSRTSILEMPDGRLTGNLEEMTKQFTKEWLTHFRPYEPEDAPLWEDFQAEFEDTLEWLKREPYRVEPLEGRQLHEFAKHWPETKAGGLDGWHVADFRQLPRVAFDRLAEI